MFPKVNSETPRGPHSHLFICVGVFFFLTSCIGNPISMELAHIYGFLLPFMRRLHAGVLFGPLKTWKALWEDIYFFLFPSRLKRFLSNELWSSEACKNSWQMMQKCLACMKNIGIMDVIGPPVNLVQRCWYGQCWMQSITFSMLARTTTGNTENVGAGYDWKC